VSADSALRLTAALGLFLCTCLQGAPARAADDAKALLALHKSYVGWELGDGTFGSMRVVEALQKTGPDGKTEDVSEFREVRRGIVYHGNYVTKNGGQRDYGLTGSVFWSSNEKGFTVPRYDEGRTPELASIIFFSEATVGRLNAAETVGLCEKLDMLAKK
jgi:hypothetical protein